MPKHDVESLPSGEPRRPAGASAVATAAALALLAAVAVAACGSEGADRGARNAAGAGWTTTFDTLPSGTIVVHNEGTDAEPGGVAAMRVDLRLGTAGGSGPELFGQLRDIDADALGRIYVLDNQAQEIRVFAADGSHVRSIGGAGGGPGEMDSPTGMEWGPGGRLWVEDPGNNRYSVYDTTGAFVTSHPRNMNWWGFSWPGFFDDAGHLYLLERSYTPEGRESWLVLRDTSMAVIDTFSVPSHEPETYELVENGLTRMATSVPFSARLTWQVAGDGTVWFGVSDEYRLYQRALAGDTLRIVEKAHEPIPVTADEREEALAEEFLQQMKEDGAEIDPARIPEHRPAWSGFTVDPDGFVWVVAQTPDSTSTFLDVFDPEGRYVGRRVLDTPIRAATLVVRGGHAYAITADDLDVQYVVRAPTEPLESEPTDWSM